MRPIRKGPFNRGPFPGAIPTEAQPNALPAPIWITDAVSKNRVVRLRTKTKIVFVKAVRNSVVAVVPKFPEVVAVLLATKRQRKLLKTRTTLRPPVKRTTVVSVRVKPIRMASLVELQRKRPDTLAASTKVFGRPTTRVKPKGPKIVSTGAFAVKQRARFNKPSVKFIKKFGRPTTNAKIRPVKVLLQTIKRARGKARLFKVPTFAQVVIVNVKPRRVYIVSPLVNKGRFKGKIRFNRVFGTVTRAPRARGPRILSYAAQRASIKYKFVPVKIKLGDVVISFTPTPPPPTTLHYIIAPKYAGQLMTRG